MAEPTEKKNITPEMAVKLLQQNGVKISENEAKKVLEIMYFLAKLVVNQNFK